MWNLIRTLLWQLHDWDLALSAMLVLPEEAPSPRAARSEHATRAIAHLGDSTLWFPLLATGWVIARHRRSRYLDAVQGGLLSLLVVAAAVLSLKAVIRRPRPRAADRDLAGPGPDRFSFPSGHAARMAASAVWASALSPAGWLLWPLAAAVGWSRTRLGIHTVGDILAGFALGATIATLVRRRHQTSASSQITTA